MKIFIYGQLEFKTRKAGKPRSNYLITSNKQQSNSLRHKNTIASITIFCLAGVKTSLSYIRTFFLSFSFCLSKNNLCMCSKFKEKRKCFPLEFFLVYLYIYSMGMTKTYLGSDRFLWVLKQTINIKESRFLIQYSYLLQDYIFSTN